MIYSSFVRSARVLGRLIARQRLLLDDPSELLPGCDTAPCNCAQRGRLHPRSQDELATAPLPVEISLSPYVRDPVTSNRTGWRTLDPLTVQPGTQS